MKIIILAGLAIAFLILSGIMGFKKRNQTLSRGNNQVLGNNQVYSSQDSIYNSISNYFAR